MRYRRRETRTLGDAKAHFAECVREAESGQAIVLTRHGRPVACLVPYEEPGKGVEEERERRVEYTAPSPSSFEKARVRRAALQRLLEKEIWPRIPPERIGRAPSKQEREEILGLGGEES